MNCPNCGNQNEEGYKFCIKCGYTLSKMQPQVEQLAPQSKVVIQEQKPDTNISMERINISQSGLISNQSVNSTISTNQSTTKIALTEYFFIILAVILKPFTAFKEELKKFNSFKNSAIMSLIISGISTLIKLITTMLNSVMVKNYDWSSGGYQTTWTWENLKEIKYLEVVGKNFLIYLGVIVTITVVYYIASLIVKKQTNFSRLLGISALAVTPLLICSLALSPLLALIWTKLAMPVTLIGTVYTIVLVYEGMNNEVLAEGNAKYYFNLVCLSILGIAAYYLCMKAFMSSITGGLDGLDNLMNMFG